MTRKTPSRRRTAKTPVTPRTVLLAGVGAVSLTRREAIRQIEAAAASAQSLRGRADAAAIEAGRQVAKLRDQAEAIAQRAQAEFEARFITKKAVRKPRRAARPAAKRSRKRA